MQPLAVGEAVVGGALLFVVPGFAVAKAVFPERRLHGPGGVRWGIELAALSLVLSVVLTVVVGYLLLTVVPGGFSASWSDPLLETSLAAIALVAFVVGLFEGAYAFVSRSDARPTPEPGAEGAWELAHRLDRLQRERRQLEREVARAVDREGAAAAAARSRISEIAREETTLRTAREAEYEL